MLFAAFSYIETTVKLTGTSLATRSTRDACAIIFYLNILFVLLILHSVSFLTRFVIVQFALGFVSDNRNNNFNEVIYGF